MSERPKWDAARNVQRVMPDGAARTDHKERGYGAATGRNQHCHTPSVPLRTHRA